MDKIKCACGCNQILTRINIEHNHKRRFINGHNLKNLWRTNKKFLKMQQKPYPIDEEFFRIISHSQAYLLGLLFTDGSFDEKRIRFCSTDIKLINFFILSLKAKKHKIRIRKFKVGKQAFSITFYNQILVKQLKNFGFLKNKNNRILHNDLKTKFFFDFLRGFLDGDGNISLLTRKKYNTLICSFRLFSVNKKLIFLIKNNLLLYHINSFITEKTLPSGKLFFTLSVSRYNSLKRLYKLLYHKKTNNFYLERKKKKFDYYLKNFIPQIINGKMSQYLKNKIALKTKEALSHPIIRKKMIENSAERRRFVSLLKERNKIKKLIQKLPLQKIIQKYKTTSKTLHRILNAKKES